MHGGEVSVAVVAMLVPLVAIIGAFTVVAVKIRARARVRELEIRERIAMIEKGIVPPPEVDPDRFDQVWGHRLTAATSVSGSRHRTAGITIMGVGFALMMIITFAGGDLGAGIGVGGGIAVLGLAFLVNSFFEQRHPSAGPPAVASRSQAAPSSAEPPGDRI